MSYPIIIIPARMESIRLPGKPMLMASGKPLVHWTYEQAKKVSPLVLITSDDSVVLNYCREHSLRWMPSRNDHPNGTSRAAEIIRLMNQSRIDRHDSVIVWQVDEPVVNPDDVKLLVGSCRSVNTLVSSITKEQHSDPNTVKVIVDSGGKAIWFSRAPMAGAFGHVGIYGFTVQSLDQVTAYSDCPYAKAESLEQLNWLYRKHEIVCFETDPDELPLSVNTEADWQKFKKLKENEVH